MTNLLESDILRVADYCVSHPGSRICDAARDLGLSYNQLVYRLEVAKRRGCAEKGAFEALSRKKISPATLEKMVIAVGMRKNGECLGKIGRAVGSTAKNPREFARQLLEIAIGLGRITRAEYETTALRRQRQESRLQKWAYFIDLMDSLPELNKNNYADIKNRHFRSLNQLASCGEYEHECLNLLVAHKSLSGSDAETLNYVLQTFKKYGVSYNQLRVIAKDYTETGISLKELALKHELAGQDVVNPAVHAKRHLKLAVALGIITGEEYDTKAMKNAKGNSGRKPKYAAETMEWLLGVRERTGQSYSALARMCGMPSYALSDYKRRRCEKVRTPVIS